MQRFRDYRLLLVRQREDGLIAIDGGGQEGNEVMEEGREEGREGREDFQRRGRMGEKEEERLFQESVCLGQELSTMSSISSGSSESLQAKTASPLGDHFIPLFHEWQTDRQSANYLLDYRIDCLSSDRQMLQLPFCQQSQQEVLETMFQDQYRDLFQSSLSEISLKESLSHPAQLTLSEQLADEGLHEDKPSERFIRILDILNQSNPSFRSKQQQRPTQTQRLKGRTMIVLQKKDMQQPQDESKIKRVKHAVGNKMR